MKLVAVAVRDSAVDAFMRPFFCPSTAFAVRSFGEAVRDPESPMNKSAPDYALYELGEFDEETGKFLNLEVPRQLVRAQDVKEK